jgi:hypothetical protein
VCVLTGIGKENGLLASHMEMDPDCREEYIHVDVSWDLLSVTRYLRTFDLVRMVKWDGYKYMSTRKKVRMSGYIFREFTR